MTPLQRVEAALVGLLIGLSRALGPTRASNFGGFLARTIGPLLAVSRVAHRNLAIALPDLNPASRARIVRSAWDNLGRTMAELPHVSALGPTSSGPGWEIVGTANLAPLQVEGARGILFSGHFANWEVIMAVGATSGLKLGGFYRAAANPGVDRLLRQLRGPTGHPAAPMFAKGAAGARGALAFLRDGGVLGFLMDQKMNDGVAATLFGHSAMTASAPASLALRYRCPILPVRLERLAPARMRLTIEPPLELPRSSDRAADILTLTQAVNDTLEQWIRARPGEWLLMHRRWPKSEYE